MNKKLTLEDLGVDKIHELTIKIEMLKIDIEESEKILENLLGKRKEGYLRDILTTVIDIRVLVDFLLKESKEGTELDEEARERQQAIDDTLQRD